MWKYNDERKQWEFIYQDLVQATIAVEVLYDARNNEYAKKEIKRHFPGLPDSAFDF